MFLALGASLLCAPSIPAGGKEGDAGKVAGILIDKRDNFLTVKADGEEAPVKYVFGKDSDKKMLAALQMTFNACRVQLTYKQDGAERRLLGIQRQVTKQAGTVTGSVVKLYDNFWIEVKPANGPADAYAPGANYNDKEFMSRLRALQPGDSVTIRFNTDFERHRILSLTKNDKK
jgi:hypothetical protein